MPSLKNVSLFKERRHCRCGRPNLSIPSTIALMNYYKKSRTLWTTTQFQR